MKDFMMCHGDSQGFTFEFTYHLKKGKKNHHPQQRSTNIFIRYELVTRYFFERTTFGYPTNRGDEGFIFPFAPPGRGHEFFQDIRWLKALKLPFRPPIFFAEISGLTSFAGYGNDRGIRQCCHGWLWRGQVDKGHRNLEQSALGFVKNLPKSCTLFSFEINFERGVANVGVDS